VFLYAGVWLWVVLINTGVVETDCVIIKSHIKVSALLSLSGGTARMCGRGKNPPNRFKPR
jgi:hypothetical protein